MSLWEGSPLLENTHISTKAYEHHMSESGKIDFCVRGKKVLVPESKNISKFLNMVQKRNKTVTKGIAHSQTVLAPSYCLGDSRQINCSLSQFPFYNNSILPIPYIMGRLKSLHTPSVRSGKST